ncbi:MAG TPA: diguanylate cyclase [Capsulimonadaceae bacterium]
MADKIPTTKLPVAVSGRRMLTADTKKHDDLLNLVFSGITDPIMVLDSELRVLDCNEAVLECVGADRDEVIGAPWSVLFPQPEQDIRDKQLDSVVADGTEWNARIPVLDFRDGGSRLYDVKSYAVRSGRRKSDVVTHVVVLMREVTDEVRTYLELVDRNRELQMIKERLEEKTALLDNANRALKDNCSELEHENSRLNVLAVVDVMTGLPNYRAFNERLHTEIKHAVLSGRPLSLLLFDVDNFKTYNDQFGHPEGDELLRQMAMIIRDSVRSADFPARYGGEEFAVLLPRTDKFGAVVVAERLRTKIEAYPMPNRRTTISIGIAEFPSDTQGVDDIIAQADKAMYVAKSYGKNTTCLWSRDRHAQVQRIGGHGSLKDVECVPVLPAGQARAVPINKRILIVDKDELLLATLRDGLQAFGFNVVTAGTGRNALTKLAEGAGTFDALISEIALADRTGFELREQANALQPDMPVIFMASMNSTKLTRSFGEDSPAEIITKPIHLPALLAVLNRAIGGPLAKVAAAA